MSPTFKFVKSTEMIFNQKKKTQKAKKPTNQTNKQNPSDIPPQKRY